MPNPNEFGLRNDQTNATDQDVQHPGEHAILADATSTVNRKAYEAARAARAAKSSGDAARARNLVQDEIIKDLLNRLRRLEQRTTSPVGGGASELPTDADPSGFGGIPLSERPGAGGVNDPGPDNAYPMPELPSIGDAPEGTSGPDQPVSPGVAPLVGGYPYIAKTLPEPFINRYQLDRGTFSTKPGLLVGVGVYTAGTPTRHRSLVGWNPDTKEGLVTPPAPDVIQDFVLADRAVASNNSRVYEFDGTTWVAADGIPFGEGINHATYGYQTWSNLLATPKNVYVLFSDQSSGSVVRKMAVRARGTTTWTVSGFGMDALTYPVGDDSIVFIGYANGYLYGRSREAVFRRPDDLTTNWTPWHTLDEASSPARVLEAGGILTSALISNVINVRVVTEAGVVSNFVPDWGDAGPPDYRISDLLYFRHTITSGTFVLVGGTENSGFGNNAAQTWRVWFITTGKPTVETYQSTGGGGSTLNNDTQPMLVRYDANSVLVTDVRSGRIIRFGA